MKLTSEIGCLICDQKLWVNLLDQENLQWTKLSMEEDLDLALEPVERFQEIMQNFSIECEQCLNIPLVCLMGRTGSGKSTLMNVLADCKPSYTKSSVGTKEICFEDGVCEVGSGATSLTKFCFSLRIKDEIFVDFAGFFDNRAGQLQVVQHLLLHHITTNRKFKLLAVKDIRTSRDLPFIDFLNLDWVTKKNTIVIFTHTNEKNVINWDRYGEGKIKKEFKTVMMPLAVKGSDFKNFKNLLREKIDKRFYSDATIKLEISAEVYQFQAEAVKVLSKSIDLELKKIITENLERTTIQPYDVEYFRSVFSNRYSLANAIMALQELGIINDQTDTRNLERLERHWTLLAMFSKQSDLDYQNWGQLTPSSNEEIVKLQRKLNDFTPPDFVPFEGFDLVKDLKTWNKLCHTHYIEHVQFRGRALTLVDINDENSFNELQRLAKYRQDTYKKIIQIWTPLEERFLKEVELDNHLTSSGKFFQTMDMCEVKGVIKEIFRFGSTGGEDLSVFSSLLSKNLGGVAIADGAIALGTFIVKMAKEHKFTIAPALGITVTATGILFGVLTAAAAGAFAYHFYLNNRQLQKIRAIGFDLVESSIWTDIETAAKNKDGMGVRRALANFEKEFRLFINSTREGVLQAKQKLVHAKLEGVDITQWQKLIDNVDQMSQGIFIEMKARESNSHGCHFREHEWNNRSFLAVNFEIFPELACCNFYLKKMMLECRHCGFLCHRDQECKLLAIQIPCKSLIRGQNDVSAVSSVKKVIQWNNEARKEELKFAGNNDMMQSAYLSKLVYGKFVVSDDELFVYEEENIKFLISTSGSTSFVVVRGTVVSNIANWITSAQAVLQRVGPDVTGRVHSGMLKAADSIYDKVWEVLDKRQSTRIVFAGHSLGGSIAHILHLKTIMRKPLESVSTWSHAYGAPMQFDNGMTQFIRRNGGKPHHFVTFVNDQDPIPSIIQTINSSLMLDILKAFNISKTKSTLVGLATNEVTKDYKPVGKYIFFEREGYWLTLNDQKSLAHLEAKEPSIRVDMHDMEEYYKRLIVFLESQSAGLIFDEKEQ